MIWFSASGGRPLNLVGFESAWVGATTHTSASVVVRTDANTNALQLAVTTAGGQTTRTAVVATASRTARIDLTGLAPDTLYAYQVETAGTPVGPVGSFRTHPAAPGVASSFTVAFSGDASSGSNHAVFDTIRQSDPLAFIHLGDLYYADNATNSQAIYHALYDQVLAQSRQAALYRSVASTYVWDDHDFGPSNSDASSPSRDAATRVYRQRVPHYPLVESDADGAIYHSFDVGRVRFIVTDQRSRAALMTGPDNAGKSMLGATQKTWFKNLLANSPDKLIVWVCSRVLGGTPELWDHWGGFTTERREIANHIKANCHGRVVVLSADRHALDIDSGVNHDFATGGGEPLRCFQASPLDRTPNTTYGGGTYSQGTFGNNGQFGTMQVADSGGGSIDVTWRGFNSAGTQLILYSFTVSV